MEKSGAAYTLILIAGLLPLVAGAVIFPRIILLFVIAAAVFGCWWTLYFRRAGYSVVAGSLVVRSGVLFRKLRCIPVENIQWVMRLKLPFLQKSVITAVHTASGSVVIFTDFSTNC